MEETGTNAYTESLNGDQYRAFQQAKTFLTLSGGGLFLLTGQAGSGKTYLTSRIIDYILNECYGARVAVTAPTHKAIGVLRSFVGSDDDTYTTHAFLGMREDIDRDGKQVFLPSTGYSIPADKYNIVIVDEASMVPDVIFDELEKLVNTRRYKVIFVGDAKQIPPVNYPDSLPFSVQVQRDLAFTVAELREIVRQAKGNPIIETASEIREAVFSPILPLSYQNKVKGLIGVSYIKYGELADNLAGIYDLYDSEEFKNSGDYVKIVAWTNEQVVKYNKLIRKHLFGDVPHIVPGDKLVSDAPLKEKKQVLVQNNMDMEVLAVDIRTQEMAGEGLDYYRAHVRVDRPSGRSDEVIIKILHEESEKLFLSLLSAQAAIASKYPKGSFQARSAWMDYYEAKETFHAVKHSYAITCHKAQGSTYDHAIVDMKNIMLNHNIEERNRILYTACTRPKHSLKIIY